MAGHLLGDLGLELLVGRADLLWAPLQIIYKREARGDERGR